MDQRASSGNHELTALLRSWSDGDERAFDQLLPIVYDELHRMALRYLAGERSQVSLQPTALVNEVCLRLLGWSEARWQNRGHFFGVSAQMMRRVLVDIARRRRAERRGGGEAVRIPLEHVEIPADEFAAATWSHSMRPSSGWQSRILERRASSSSASLAA